MRQAGLSLLVGIGIGMTVVFLLVAHDRSQRAVEALGQAYEASRPTGTPVVQAVPIENPPPVSPGSAAQGGAPQTAQNPDQNAVQPLASSQAPTDTPLALGGSPGGTSRAASGEGTSRAVPFLGVQCQDGYITAFWPGGPFYYTWRNWSGGTPPGQPHTIPPGNPPTDLLPARILLDCDSEFADLAKHHPGERYTVYVYPSDSAVYLALEVTLGERPKTAGQGWY